MNDRSVEIFAPGKLFIFGEWSVLEGGPALLRPVDAGQSGSLSFQGGPTPEFRFVSPEYSAQERVWRFEEGSWVEKSRPDGAEIDIVGAVLSLASERLSAPTQGARLCVRSRGMKDASGAKMGYGSSASVCVLSARALGELCGASEEEVLCLALDAHRRAQRGKGSGADVAVSFFHRDLCYTLKERIGLDPWQGGDVETEVEPLSVPAPVAMAAIWTGQSANTRTMMAEMRQLRAENPSLYAEKMSQLARIAQKAIIAWKQGDAHAVLEFTREAHRGLEALGRAAGVEIVIPAHHEIRAVVEEACGECAAIKPSGAGGGDMALLMANSSEQLHIALKALVDRGYPGWAWV